MQIIIRSLKSGQYYQTPGKWTANQKEARNFETLNEAMAFARQNYLASVEILLAFDDPHRDIHFPLQDVPD
jgi:hypothetical protein